MKDLVSMADSVFLNAAQRQFLTARTEISRARNTAADRLATGQRVSRITDDAVSFLRGQALTQRAGALRDAKADISQGISALQAAQTGTQAIEDLTDQLKGIALAAQSADATEKAQLTQQFDTVRQQIDNLANDASYQGLNLLANPAGDLDVNLSDQPSTTFTVQGQASDVAALGIGNAASYNNFGTQADIDNAIAAIDAATETIRSNESSIGSNASFLGIREDFSANIANILEEGAAKLTRADMNEEAARLLAANVRDAMAVRGQRIAAQSDRLIVNMIRGT